MVQRSGRVAWRQVLILAITETFSWGVLYYAFSVFLTPMSIDLGWSHARLTGAFSVALLVSGLAAVAVGRWLDRHGPRGLMTAGSCLATGLVLAWAGVDSLPLFYLIWVGLGFAMAAVLYEPALATVANWFPQARERGRALTLLTFVAGFASVIFLPLSGWLVRSQGWRAALVYLALLLGVATIPLHWLGLRERPGARDRKVTAGTGWTVREALRGGAFWWLSGAFMLAMLALVAVTIHLIPLLLARGYSATFATSAAGGIGLMALPGRLLFTPLGSVLPRHIVTAAMFALQALSLVVLARAEREWHVVLFVILFGASFGAVTPARAALVAERFGTLAYGGISGV
ncbi:MAG: MFS transporter, partial [Chloroflexota bacterium]|nr:MFS transporter [Chloroflexota bacterium]